MGYVEIPVRRLSLEFGMNQLDRMLADGAGIGLDNRIDSRILAKDGIPEESNPTILMLRLG